MIRFIRLALLLLSAPLVLVACGGGGSNVKLGPSLSTVGDLSFEVGVPIEDIRLPAGSGGQRPYTYALSCSPALDGTGVVFTPGTRLLQGRPIAAYSGVCDYSVTDAQQASAHRSFRLEVVGRDRLTFRPSELFVPEEGRGSYIVGLSAVAPVGGVQITIRRESGADPHLLFDTDLEARGRQTSLFIPEGLSEGTVWVDALRDSDREEGHADLYHVANPVNPDTGTPTATGTIRVHEVEPAFELPAVEDQSFQVGLPDSVILPIAARGIAPYRYALRCEPPLVEVGLEWDPSARRLHGTPTEAYRVDCVYSATDARGPDYRVERRFTVNISSGFTLPPVDNLSFDVGIPVDVRLPAGSRGQAPYTYALSCNPGLDGTGLNPPRRTGLVFTPGTRQLQGRPETAYYGVCDYSVTDARGDSAHRAFSIDISGRDKLTIRPAELFVHERSRSHYTVRLSAPAPSGGVQVTVRPKPGADPSFRIDADLGALGLQNTLYIPPDASEGQVYVYADADADSVEGCMDVFNIVNSEQPDASPATGTIRVCEVEPKFELPAVEDQSFEVGVSRSVTLPIAVRGTPPYRYALSCRPPLASLELAFTPDTRVLGGTPTTAHRAVDCVYSATDGNNDRVEQTFTVTVAPSTLSLPLVGNYSFDVGKPENIQLPAANGDFPPWTYALSCTPALDGTSLNPPRPTGLVFTPGTRRLQGRPETAYYGVCDYSVTDARGTSAHRSFSIDVSGRDKLTIRPTELFVREGSLDFWTVGLSAPAGVGGVQIFVRPKPGADPSFRIDADLGAAGLQNSLYIPRGQSEGRVYVHADPDTDSVAGFMDVFHIVNPEQPGASPATGTIRVHEVESTFKLPAVADQSFEVGVPRPVTLPAAAGGTPPYRYALSCQPVLGGGLTFTTSTRVLDGTPNTSYLGECAYSATDTANNKVERAFTITIDDILALPEVRNRSFVAGQAVNIQLPPARSDSPPYTYALSCTPTLPTALVFTPGTRRLQGTPATGDIDYYACSYTATDARGTEAGRKFSIDVSGSDMLTFRPSTLSVREGDTASYVVGLSALAPTGGIQIRVVKKSGADPSFRIDADPGTSGDQNILTIPAGQNEGTVDVHADPDTDSVAGSMDVFHIVTTANQPKATGTISVQEIESRLELPAVEDQSFELGIGRTVTLPPATGGASPYRYALDCRPSLGSFGLAFTATNRVLAGTPGAAYRGVECTYSATDGNNDRADRAFTLTVVDPSFAPLALISKGDQTLTVAQQVNVALLMAAGGTPPYTYLLDCPGGLPSGLAFSSATGVLTGRPTAPYYAACDYSASDSSTPARRTFPESLVLEVVRAPDLSLAEVSNQSFAVGTPENVLLPAASNGQAPYTYALSCTPALTGTGLVFTPGTRRLQGRPGTAYYGVCDYSATDAQQRSAHRSFSIDVSGRDRLTIRPTELFVHEGGRSFYTVGLSAPAPAPGGVQISVRKKTGADPSFRIDTDLVAFGEQNTLYISPGASEGRVYVYADTDGDATAGSMEVFNIVSPEQPGASPATGTVRVHEVEPAFELRAVDDQTFQLGVARSVTLPVAVGGMSPYTYALTCRPTLADAGLTFTASTRVLSGTSASLTVEYLGVDCVYSATDNANTRVEQVFTVTIGDPSSGLTLRSAGDQTFKVGDRVNIQLLQALSGTPPYTYALECPPGVPLQGNPLRGPNGLNFSTATGVLSGIPSAPFHVACDYSASDSSSPVRRTLPQSLLLSITGSTAGVLRIVTTGFSDDPVDFPIEQTTRRPLPPVEGGTAPYQLSLEGCPDWVRLSGGNLLGYPPNTDSGAPVACTFKVSDSAPTPATDSYAFYVRAQHPPATSFYFETRHVVERNLPVGQPITPIVLPRALNGKAKQGSSNVVLTYTLQPALPRGLCLYETTTSTAPATSTTCTTGPTEPNQSYQRVADNETNYLWIIGTPEFSSVLRRYCWTVSDEAGTPPPSERCFYLATVSYDVPRFTNLTETSYSATVLSIILSKTTPCDGCPTTAIGTAAPDSPDKYEIKLPLPIRPSDWVNTGDNPDGFFSMEPRFGKTNSLFSFVAPSDPLDHPIVRWSSPADVTTRVITGNGAEPHVAYTYGVSRTSTGKGQEAAICFDLRYIGAVDANGSPLRRFVETKGATNDNPRHGYEVQDWIVTHRFRDEATRRSTGEFVCFPRPLGDDSPSSNQRSGASADPTSNPVHEALGPVHARQATGVAHDAIRDRLRAWEADRAGQSWSVTPRIGFGSLSGTSDGFDYSGSSESLTLALDTGQAAWQAGLVAAATRTDLTYRAEAALRARGYASGEHDTELYSVHPFAAWHAPAGGHVYGSLGAGSGTLRHRDAPDSDFPDWSRSDVQLRTWAVGAAVPLADVLSGALHAEADVESFAFDIKGGDAISTTLPTLHGTDWRAGLAWSAPVAGTPALSVAYKRQTGDGPEGARMEAAGSVAFAGLLDSRLTVSGNAEASFGLGDLDHDTWGLGGALDFASGHGGRGVSLDLDTRVVSLDAGRSAGAGMQAEAGYGLWGGRVLGLVRPYVGVSRYPGEATIRRAVGVYLRDTPLTHVSVEMWDHADDPGMGLRARHRF